MPINTLEFATILQSELDKQAVQGATSGFMELNSSLVKYTGGAEVKIPKLTVDGLGDYDRDNGFVQGAITLDWETRSLTMDRGRTFHLDRNDVDETNFVVSASAVAGEFQRRQVIPELDAYRYSKIASTAITNSRATGGYTAAVDTILAKIKADMSEIEDVVGSVENLVVVMSIPVATILDQADKIKPTLSTTEMLQGGVKTRVPAIDNAPIIRVSSARMKTAYVFKDGTTTGQTAGGFAADAAAKNVNWIVMDRTLAIAVSKTDVLRVFSPDVNQKADAWKIDYRKYHDLWILDNKLSNMKVNIKESLS